MGECRSFHPRHSGGHIPPGSSPRTISLPQDISPGCQRENLKTGSNPYSINFVHVNGRSLYIVYQRMVVVEGGCPTPRERGGEIVHGNCPGRICPGEYIQGTCPDPSRETLKTCTSPVSQTTTFFFRIFYKFHRKLSQNLNLCVTVVKVSNCASRLSIVTPVQYDMRDILYLATKRCIRQHFTLHSARNLQETTVIKTTTKSLHLCPTMKAYRTR